MNKNFILLVFFLMGCGNADQHQHTASRYFDLKGFFEREAARLTGSSPLVHKTVSVNGEAETKNLKISDWTNELSAFTNADINKSAWTGLFKVAQKDHIEVYTTTEDKVPVKSMYITKKNGRVSGIKILMNTSNYLYKSMDTLTYYPDSVYEIRKTQHIKLLNTKRYQITGAFLKK